MTKRKGNKNGYRVLFVITLIVVVSTLGFTAYLGVSASMEGRSAASKFFDVNIDLFMTGDKYVSPEKTLEKVEKRREANKNYHIPAIHSFLYNCTVTEYGGVETAEYNGDDEDVVIYFHGGSYMWQPTLFHFRYCRYLADTLGTAVLMPIYPKAPNHTYRETLAAMKDFYERVSEKKNVLAFVGDSAGGGLLLSFAAYLSDLGYDTPEHLITFSPCLDLKLENEAIAKYTAADPMLNWADLKLKFSFYADGDFTDPYVSPIYADFSRLGKWTCFVGTEEILLPDALLLNEKLTSLGIEHDFFLYKNQFHTFAIFPIPESEEIGVKIKKILQ